MTMGKFTYNFITPFCLVKYDLINPIHFYSSLKNK